MTFEKYCGDVLKLSVRLMSVSEIKKAIVSYENWLKRHKKGNKKNVEIHLDMKKPLSVREAQLFNNICSKK